MYKAFLSMRASCFIRLRNTFVLPNLESPNISILYGWSIVCSWLGLCSCVVLPVTVQHLCHMDMILVHQVLVVSCHH